MKILVFGYGHKSTAAVSNILLNLSKAIASNESTEIVLFGYGESDSSQKINKSISIISSKDVFLKKFSFYRVFRKISFLFHFDTPCLSWKKLYRKAKTLFKDEKFDYVIGASGYYMYMNAAYHFAVKNNYKFVMINFDPFASNITAKNKKRRLKYEQKWYNYSSLMLQNKEGNESLIEDKQNKIRSFQIPLFEKKFNFSPEGPVVYGGSFYNKFRSSDVLLNFLKKDMCKKEKIVVYSNRKNEFYGLNNVESNSLVGLEKFDEVCKNAKALIIIGNKNVNAIPSKLIHALSYKKPIIGINTEGLNALLSRYPFYFEANDDKLFDKISLLKETDFNKYDVYSSFPELNPNILIRLLMERIK